MKKSLLLIVFGLLLSLSSFALGPITGTFGECVGVTTHLYDGDSSSGVGTWSSSDPSVATVTSFGVFYETIVTGISVGTAIITYTVGGSFVTATFTVSGPGLPGAVTGTTSFCIGTISTLSDATPGGIWTSSSPGVATVGSTTGLVTGVSGGTASINYSLGGWCSTDAEVTINATDPGYIWGGTYVCVGGTITLTDNIDSTYSGTWSSSDPSIATISTGGVVTGISVGTVTISYTVSGPCGTASATQTVTVSNTTSLGTIAGPSTLNIGASAALYDGYGTWSSANPGIAEIGSSTGIVTGISLGSTMITFTTTGCGGVASTTAPITVTSFDGISGHVICPDSAFYAHVKVWLIHFNPATNMLTALDSVSGYSSSNSFFYQFSGAGTDSFRIKAAYDEYSYDSIYIPTYHTSSFYWHDADVVFHTTGTYDINEDINMATGIVTTGPGFIAGDVTTGANKGTAGGAPATGLHLCIVNSTTHAIVQQTHTDASGHYSFSNLPVGQTYYVFPDSLNYITTAYSGITLTPAAPSMTTAKFTMHTVSHTITPFATGISMITSQTPSIIAFPNPTSGKLNIEWNINATEKGNVTISDITGREIYTSTINMNQGTGTFQADLSALTNGLYMISVKSATIIYNNKIQVQH